MDDKLISGRLEEINEGLCNQTGGLTETHFRKTKRLGAAVRVANLIKGQDVISDYNYLLAAAGELKIPADTLDKSLEELQEIGYVSLHKSSGEIKKIEERIPLMEEQYAAIGEKWRITSPSDIEKITVTILDELMIAPHKERGIINKFNLDPESFGIISDVGKTGAFYASYTSPVDGSSIGFSPLYHDENPEKLIALFEKFPTENVSEKVRRIRNYQGFPLENIFEPILIEAIKMGCIPTPSVNSTSGEKFFAFTPLKGVGKLEKALLEKARAIVSCVRYGQTYAGITKINDPLAILNRLKYSKRIGSHSEIKQQYALLHKLGVGRVTNDTFYSGRFNFEVIDTIDNMRSLDLAIQYLTVKEVVKIDESVLKARQLLLPGVSGSYGSTTMTRMSTKNLKHTQMSASSIDALNHLMMGGSSGIE